MTDNWGKPQTMEDLLVRTDRRLTRQERRASAVSAADLLGPGMNAQAVQLFDWNAEEATFNGFFYSYPNAFNTPDVLLPWTGQVIARNDGSGMQQVWNTDDPEGMRYWVRTYSPTPGDPENVVFTAWQKFASPSGFVDEDVLHPDIVNNIDQALADSADAMDFAIAANKTFRQDEEPTDTAEYELRVNDTWYDTNDENQPYVWDGDSWASVRDLQIEASQIAAEAAMVAATNAVEDAEAAMDYALTKNTVYRQTAMPTGGTYIDGDVWYDTDGGNRIYLYDGAAWVDTTTAYLDTILGTPSRGIKISTTGLRAYDAVGVQTLNISATTGSILMMGSLTAGSDISGATVTGGTVQSESTASRGIKMNSTGLTAYNNVGTPTLTITASTGAISMVGALTSGSTIAGATVTGGTLQSEATASRGVKITSVGMNVYNTSGVVVFSALASGVVTVTGAISASTIDGSTVTGGTVQTEVTANRGIKLNSTGLAAYTSGGVATFTITAATGAVLMKGDLTSGSTITGAAITGSTVFSATATGGYAVGLETAIYQPMTPVAFATVNFKTGSTSMATIQYVDWDSGALSIRHASTGAEYLIGSLSGGIRHLFTGAAKFSSTLEVVGNLTVSGDLNAGALNKNAIKSDVKAVNISALNTDSSASVSFGTAFPAGGKIPNISLTIEAANPGNFSPPTVGSVTRSGFNIILRRSAGATGNVNVHWIASAIP